MLHTTLVGARKMLYVPPKSGEKQQALDKISAATEENCEDILDDLFVHEVNANAAEDNSFVSEPVLWREGWVQWITLQSKETPKSAGGKNSEGVENASQSAIQQVLLPLLRAVMRTVKDAEKEDKERDEQGKSKREEPADASSIADIAPGPVVDTNMQIRESVTR